MTFRIEVFKGPETAKYLRTLSEMRVQSFSEFPFLYVGKVEDDLAYTQIFSTSPQGILVVAFKDETIVGIRSGVPATQIKLLDEERYQQLEKLGINGRDYYFCGELIVNPAFRRMGIAGQLMTKYIEEVNGMGFPGMFAISSARAPNHPLRPQNYFEGSTILSKYGFEKSPIVFTAQYLTQQPDGTAKVEDNQLACWIRKRG